ncbi:RNA dependent RNA polymerase-domain-containing protein [Ephemerocybe angulata]|uniref:RNA-dependent RNA polymerase n=1 Tax=Ephemerocybe angulata TaxID=980116 RepID=A0A8H6IGV0_9AGAR|nr:RNA dependent RNA polymerase-domain-containing protein [Tulosesus angulatus]
MNIDIRFVPTEENEWTVTRAISSIIHADEFAVSEEEKRVNFKVELNPNETSGVGHNHTGTLTLPTAALGRKFLNHVRDKPIKLSKQKLKFYRSQTAPRKHVVATLGKTPFVSPDIEEKHVKTMWALEDNIRLETVQFGTLYRPVYPGGRAFSVEWEKRYTTVGLATLKLEYDHKLIRISLGDPQTEHIGYTVAINFASIRKIGVGYDFGQPYVLFDTLTPPVMEVVELHRTLTGDKAIDNEKYKWRVGSLDERHDAVAAYATQIRILLYHDQRVDKLEEFVNLCEIAGIGGPNIIARFHPDALDASSKGFFVASRLARLHREFAQLPWPAAFQLEALLRNGLLHTGLIEELLPQVKQLCKKHKRNDSVFVGELLRAYNQALQMRNTHTNQEHPVQKTFKEVLAAFDFSESDLMSGNFRCGHVTFTPTRLILEGPYATQSNRIIRQYQQFAHHFIRVDFRDEDRLQYRWDRSVDGTTFLRERVGGTLKGGFDLAGRSFEFLAYSSSALKEHAVWFVTPFEFVLPSGKAVWVNAEYIRHDIGDFHGTELLRHPSKYAARLAQAFTATDSSVKVHRNNWEEVPDLGNKPYLFTDGVGTISKDLRDRIWEAMIKNGKRPGNVVPSAFQIRFLGFKGVVAEDGEMDETNKKRGPGEHHIHMRLRGSMKKFENDRLDEAEIEIAQAFHAPNVCYLNRPLVMLLEDLGTRRDEFLKLQDIAIAEARTIDGGIKEFHRFLSGHGLGNSYRMPYLLGRLRGLGLDINPNSRSQTIDTPFLRLLRSVAITEVLRDIKHSARIPIPESYLLVGIADEGVAYEEAGYENVFKLEEGHIYACIQRPEDKEPTWLEGMCSISRSPVVHPGDVQRVYAIGKPPDDCFCAFRDLKNLVVLPSVGDRSLASCLGGGDVDGDLFAVITDPSLLPSQVEEPANYEPLEPELLDRDCEVNDICDFVVEYINSDVLGLLSVRLLIIADQSKEGFMDPACLILAALCSQAVDYPKQGIPVDLNGFDLPRTLIRCKPDWHAAEVVSPRETDYYRSERALGYLFRTITLDDITEEDKKLSPSKYPPLTDAISKVLMPYVRECIGVSSRPGGDFAEVEKIFHRYVAELDYICVTHTLSNTPGVRLLEAEVVAGTILAKCSQKRMRQDRIYRVRTHSQALVEDAKKDLAGKNPDTIELYLVGLKKAWKAWEFTQKFSEKHGANSFGFIALGVIFDCLGKLGVQLPEEKD